MCAMWLGGETSVYCGSFLADVRWALHPARRLNAPEDALVMLKAQRSRCRRDPNFRLESCSDTVRVENSVSLQNACSNAVNRLHTHLRSVFLHVFLRKVKRLDEVVGLARFAFFVQGPSKTPQFFGFDHGPSQLVVTCHLDQRGTIKDFKILLGPTFNISLFYHAFRKGDQFTKASKEDGTSGRY